MVCVRPPLVLIDKLALSDQLLLVPDLNDRLGEGPHVAVVLTRVNGYAAECERTYFTAAPSTEARKTFAAMMEARRIAFCMIRPGLPCSELDAAVNDYSGALRHLPFSSRHSTPPISPFP